MTSVCGAYCVECNMKEDCKGCAETCASPFGGKCIAAEYIKTGGKAAYTAFRIRLLAEINKLLEAAGIPRADTLHELPGHLVNLEYRLPCGDTVRFLKDENIYLGTQIEFADMGICYGVVADMDFILICSYSVDGSEPEIVLYKKR